MLYADIKRYPTPPLISMPICDQNREQKVTESEDLDIAPKIIENEVVGTAG